MRGRTSAHRRDQNHHAIAAALRSAGWHVLDLSQVGNGCPDLLGAKGGRIVLLEVKDGAKPPSARVLSDDEVDCHAAFARAGVHVVVLESVSQAARL